MISVANEVVNSYELTLYRRHPSGIDRWYPHSVPVTGRQSDTPDQSAAKRATSEAAAATAAAAKPKPRPQAQESEAQKPAPRRTDERQPDVQPAAKADVRPAQTPEPAPEHKAEQRNHLNAPPITQAVPITASAQSTVPPPPITQAVPTISPITTQVPLDEHATPNGPDSSNRSQGFTRSRCGSDRRRSCRRNQACVRRHGLRPLAPPRVEPPGQRLAASMAKKSRSSLPASSARTPATTGGRWLSRGSPHIWYRLTTRAGLWVGGAEHHPPDAGVDQRAGAHHARLQRDVQRAIEQPPVARRRRRHRGSPAPRRVPWGRRSARARCAERRSPAPSRTTTAPIGTSPWAAAAAACSRANCIASWSVSGAIAAEGVGFEPTEGCPSHAFQACRFGRSRTPPGAKQG